VAKIELPSAYSYCCVYGHRIEKTHASTMLDGDDTFSCSQCGLTDYQIRKLTLRDIEKDKDE